MPSIERFRLKAFASVLGIILFVSGCNHHSDRTTRMRWSSGGESRTLEVRGAVEFADDDRDVKSISPGGSVFIDEGSWLQSRRSYKVSADSSGLLERTYKVGNSVRPIDADAQAWIAGVVLTLIRETGVDAGPRTERLLKTGGPAAVLRDVAEIRSDGSKRAYLRELVDRGKLSDTDFRDVMRSARTIGSDGDKTGLLLDVSRSYLGTSLRESWFTTLSGIGSDGDKRRALQHTIRNDSDAETLALTARAAAGIGSDGDKAAVLSEIATRGLEPAMRRPWFRAFRTIGSDGDKAMVLRSVLGNLGSDAETMVEVLHAVQQIGSDGDKSSILVEAARSPISSVEVRRAFFAAINTVGSDGDRKRILLAALQGPELLTHVAESARKMGSDEDKTEVLARAAELEMNDPAARAAFFTAISTIGSDGERMSILSRFLNNPRLGPETIVAAVEGAAALGSDEHKASLLMKVAERHGSDPAVHAALETALRSVHSDRDYRRVSDALRR